VHWGRLPAGRADCRCYQPAVCNLRRKRSHSRPCSAYVLHSEPKARFEPSAHEDLPLGRSLPRLPVGWRGLARGLCTYLPMVVRRWSAPAAPSCRGSRFDSSCRAPRHGVTPLLLRGVGLALSTLAASPPRTRPPTPTSSPSPSSPSPSPPHPSTPPTPTPLPLPSRRHRRLRVRRHLPRRHLFESVDRCEQRSTSASLTACPATALDAQPACAGRLLRRSAAAACAPRPCGRHAHSGTPAPPSPPPPSPAPPSPPPP
jgi:hypothetical protein